MHTSRLNSPVCNAGARAGSVGRHEGVLGGADLHTQYTNLQSCARTALGTNLVLWKVTPKRARCREQQELNGLLKQTAGRQRLEKTLIAWLDAAAKVVRSQHTADCRTADQVGRFASSPATEACRTRITSLHSTNTIQARAWSASRSNLRSGSAQAGHT